MRSSKPPGEGVVCTLSSVVQCGHMCVHMLRSSRPIDGIYSIMREMADPDTVRFDEAWQRILAKGYTPNQFDECLDKYERLNVWQVNQSRTRMWY